MLVSLPAQVPKREGVVAGAIHDGRERPILIILTILQKSPVGLEINSLPAKLGIDSFMPCRISGNEALAACEFRSLRIRQDTPRPECNTGYGFP